MFSRNNIKYILILAIGFFWCSSIYLTQEQYLLNYMSDVSVNIVDMLFGSLSMAVGIILFSILYKRKNDIKKTYILFLLLSLLFSISFFLISSSIIMSIILCLICLLGSAGFGAGYHFALTSSNVQKEYIGRVFAIGYALGTLGTYFISLLPSNFLVSSKSLIIYIPLIITNILLINKYGNLKEITVETKTINLKKYLLIITSKYF